jgi:hypothetical protein
MDEKYRHSVEGYHWEREKVKEDTLEGWLEFDGRKVMIKGDRDESAEHIHQGGTSLTHVLQHLGKNTEVKIKIEAWNHKEVEETSNFDPFKEEKKHFDRYKEREVD